MEESQNQLHTVRKEITRSGSENNVDMRETEVTEVTETVEGGTITTVKRKVVTVIQGKEQVIEDSQIVVDGNDTAFSSVIDSGFVVVDKEDGQTEQKEISINVEENGELILFFLIIFPLAIQGKKLYIYIYIYIHLRLP